MSIAPNTKVLLVEDDPALRKLVKGYLSLMGLVVSEASDGRSAMTQLTQAVPDLLVLDLMLPESSGYDVCEFVRGEPALRHLPIVMMSARTLPEDRAQAEELGVTAYLVKPFSRAEFSQRILEVLSSRTVRTP